MIDSLLLLTSVDMESSLQISGCSREVSLRLRYAQRDSSTDHGIDVCWIGIPQKKVNIHSTQAPDLFIETTG